MLIEAHMEIDGIISKAIESSPQKEPPKEITFRTWKKEDIPSMARMAQELYRYIEMVDPVWRTSPHAADHLRAHLDDLYTKRYAMTYVACNNQEIIGFVTGTIIQRPPVILPQRDGLIDNAFIMSSWRDQGIGTRLVHMLLRWFREQGVEEVRIHYQVSNKRAVTFWEKMGFCSWTMQAHLWLYPEKRKKTL
jgi:ribosomal protein S18 acetylase RimI-like enzyme